MRPADGGGGDPFDGMTHEEMLKWIDGVDHSTMQHHADKLKSAAKEIHKIAGELGKRPKYVEWKGDGADAFRTWSGDIAKSATQLGDFSQTSGHWLGEAAAAAGNAKSRMPKVPKPDETKCYDTSQFGPGAKDPAQDKAREEAIAEMRKVNSAYSQASGEMAMADRPVFPPMPKAMVPPAVREDGGQDVSRSTGSQQLGTPSQSATGSATHHAAVTGTIGPAKGGQAEQLQTLHGGDKITTGLDSVDLPERTVLPQKIDVQPPAITGPTDPGLPVNTPPPGQPGGLKRTLPIGRGGMPTQEHPVTGGRVSPKPVTGGVPQQRPTQNPTTMGRAANTSRGIVGGHPQPKSVTGRATGMPRGPVVGGNKSVQPGRGVQGRPGAPRNTSPMGRTTGIPRNPAQSTGRPPVVGPRPGQASLNETQRTVNPGQKTAPVESTRGGVANSVPTRGSAGPRALPPQNTGGVIGASAQQPQQPAQQPQGTPAQPRSGVPGAVPSHEPLQRMQNPSTSGVLGAGNAPQQGEQRQGNEPKKPYQPQPGVNTEPQKQERPEAD